MSAEVRAADQAPLSGGTGALDEVGRQVVDQSRPTAERLQLIRALEEWATPQVRPPLLEALKDPQPEIRAAAARALGWQGNVEAVPALRERVEAPGEATVVKAAALRALSGIGEPSARAVVVARIGDPDAPIREAALWGVTFGNLVVPAERTPYLVRLAEDQALDAQLRAEAIRTLADVKEERVAEVLTRILEREPRLTIALPRGAPTREQTMSLRYAQARDVAAWAAQALGQLEARTALPLLLASAEEPKDFFLRQVSVRALVIWNVPEAFPVLVRRLQDPLPEVRTLSLIGLARLGDRHALEPALARLSDEIAPVRAQAVMTVAVLGDPAVVRPKLETMQQTEMDSMVRGALDAALAKLPR